MARKSGIPQSPIFVCEEHRFSVLDSSVLDDFLQNRAEAWLELSVGPDSIFETRPIKVIERSRNEIWVVTTDYTVKYNLLTGEAHKTEPDGSQYEFRVESTRQGDGRSGWILVSRT